MLTEEMKNKIIEDLEASGLKLGKDFTEETLEELGFGLDEKKDKKEIKK